MWATGVLLTVAALSASSCDAGYLPNDDAGTPCEYKEFQCESGECVPRESWCDGMVNCPDDTDEKYCKMLDPLTYKAEANVNECDLSRYFQCQNAMCIPKSGRCNDMPDCMDGEDEEDCDYLYETNEDTDSKPTSPITPLETVPTTPPVAAPTTTVAPSTTSDIASTSPDISSTSDDIVSTSEVSNDVTTEDPPLTSSEIDTPLEKHFKLQPRDDITTSDAPPPSSTTADYVETQPSVKYLPRVDVTTSAPPPPTPLANNLFTTSQTMAFSAKVLPRGGDMPWLPSRFDLLQKSVRHVLDGRDSTWGWGRATPRVATALALVNSSYFERENYDGMLTKKQLQVQLALDLMKQHERPMRLQDLSHYVQALLATCSDPRDFHGVDVARLLKRSVSRRNAKGLFVGPSAYLALCNSGHAPLFKRIKNMAYRRHDEPRWLDVQSYALLAISCRCALPGASEDWWTLKKDVARNLSEWQQDDGGFGTVHSTGLALQALIAAEEPGTEGTKGRALTHLLLRQDWQGSYGSELDNYFVLPALSGTSLAALGKLPCRPPHHHNTQGTEGAEPHHPPRKGGGGILVHYSLWVGGAANEIQTVTVGLPRHSDFLQVMRAAEKINPRFKADVLQTSRATAVHAIGGRASDVHRSTYWTLYRKVPVPFRPRLANVTATDAKLKLLGAKRWTKDLRKLHPKDGEHLAFWYKPYM